MTDQRLRSLEDQIIRLNDQVAALSAWSGDFKRRIESQPLPDRWAAEFQGMEQKVGNCLHKMRSVISDLKQAKRKEIEKKASVRKRTYLLVYRSKHERGHCRPLRGISLASQGREVAND